MDELPAKQPSFSKRYRRFFGFADIRHIPRIARIGALAAYAAASADAASLAASLADFAPLGPVATVQGTSARSFSAVTWQPETQSLFVIDNDDSRIYVLDASGALIRIVTTTGLSDPEGISSMGGGVFLIAEEGRANIVRVALPASGTGPVAVNASTATVLNIGPDMGNAGIEGVSYCAACGEAYAVKEINPSRMYRITLDDEGKPMASVPDEPFSLADHDGDVSDILALDDGNFILVNQERSRLEGYDGEGRPLSVLALDLAKPEGVAYDSTTQTLFVVGEPNEFTALRSTATQTRIGILTPGKGSWNGHEALRSRKRGWWLEEAERFTDLLGRRRFP